MQSVSAAFLTPADVRNIQRYVTRKYAGLPNERHTEIVTDAMQRIVMRQLPLFAERDRLALTERLLREVVTGQQIPVGPEHVFTASLQRFQCSDCDSAMSRLWLDPLHAWSEDRLQLNLDRERFSRFIRQAADEVSLSDDGLDQPQLWQSLMYEAQVWSNTADKAGQAPIHASNITPIGGLTYPDKPWSLKRRPKLYGWLCALMIGSSLLYGWYTLVPVLPERLQPPMLLEPVKPLPVPVPAPRLNELPEELRYTDVNRSRLIDFLNRKNSLLAEPLYLDTILTTAKKFDIHPLLLFAITGQEQSFVPRTHKNASKMVNNPFNVYHSHLEYNTNLHDAAAIASRTINNLSRKRPSHVDAITWINRKYAEDKNWAKGVTSLLGAMKRHVESSAKE